MVRSDYIATREDSLLLIIDFQQAMLKAMGSWEMIAGKVRQLIQSANVLEVPILLTEQYKKGLGETLPDLIQELQSPQVFQKEHFSACMEDGFLSINCPVWVRHRKACHHATVIESSDSLRQRIVSPQ
jgi:hypothetical protein